MLSMVQRWVVEGDGVSIADPDIENDWESKGLQRSMFKLMGPLMVDLVDGNSGCPGSS